MILANEAFAVPGADDEVTLDDIIGPVKRDFSAAREAVRELAEVFWGNSTALGDEQRKAVVEAMVEAFLAGKTAALPTLSRVDLRCYYRDDRVLRSLDLEPHPPFPLGPELAQEDWPLLDALGERPAQWRDVRWVRLQAPTKWSMC